jgi:hypothetical protein
MSRPTIEHPSGLGIRARYLSVSLVEVIPRVATRAEMARAVGASCTCQLTAVRLPSPHAAA